MKAKCSVLAKIEAVTPSKNNHCLLGGPGSSLLSLPRPPLFSLPSVGNNMHPHSPHDSP